MESGRERKSFLDTKATPDEHHGDAADEEGDAGLVPEFVKESTEHQRSWDGTDGAVEEVDPPHGVCSFRCVEDFHRCDDSRT